MGIIAGFYLYVVGFTPLFYSDVVSEESDLAAFTIVGEAYGGCRSSCPTFRVTNDGTYRYFFTPGVGQAQVLRDGRLPFALQRELRQAVTEERLIAQSSKIQPSTCSSYTDGIDVRYTVTLDGRSYLLDSCGTAVIPDQYPWAALAKIWNYFETTSS